MSMQVIVSCDYLVSPAFCDSSMLSEKVSDLIAIKRELDDGGNKVIIESDSLAKLSELELYPCTQIFNHNIPAELRTEFAPKDIAAIVRSIASMLVEDDECLLPECAGEWNSIALNPQLEGCKFERFVPLTKLVEDVFLASQIHHKSLSILHHPLGAQTNAIKITGELKHSVPELSDEFPIALSDEVKIYSTYPRFLAQFNSSDMYQQADTPAKIHAAIMIGAATILQRSGNSELQKFSFGENFIESLHAHQCAPGQKFSNTAFDVICHVIASLPKYPHNPMYSDLNKKTQKKKNEALGWRTQITKGNPALRLMYWSKDDTIELANVGNKKELVIL
ncbi:hypothetical protein [Pseudomonas sp. B21-031]|uniref:hypothetical protein n=1 Tax=Pseudomonas sp. B21-031 TaxID=2895482 RepID=UPI002160821E|nr:hypothetical protein [Pseudomonas sp. B21-031]UVL65704.1 hypothetical protein LOY53_20140 [Pseudomonas sp. B21-031]